MMKSDQNTQAQVFTAFLESTPETVVFLDPTGRVRFWSRSAEALLHIESSEFADHSSVKAIVQRKRDSNTACMCNETMAEAQLEAGVTQEELVADGGNPLVTATSTELVIENENWKMFILNIPTRQSDETSELYRMAHTDDLTQLLNRRGFQSALESNLDRRLVLAIVDVDFLKRINDEHGHEAGDQALQWIAQQIVDQVPSALGIGRLGGDEFGVVMEWPSTSDLQSRFQGLCDRVAAGRFAGGPSGITISIGVAVAPGPDSTARNLLTTADRAMYLSKNEGRNRVTVVEVD